MHVEERERGILQSSVFLKTSREFDFHTLFFILHKKKIEEKKERIEKKKKSQKLSFLFLTKTHDFYSPFHYFPSSEKKKNEEEKIPRKRERVVNALFLSIPQRSRGKAERERRRRRERERANQIFENFDRMKAPRF